MGLCQQAAAQDTQLKSPEGLLEAWVDLWRTYDLSRVDDLFLDDARLSYFSSEKEGVMLGLDAIVKHHEGFGFVKGGMTTPQALWVDDVQVSRFEKVAVITAIWYFGDRSDQDSAQRGPMTAVMTPVDSEYRIAHMHFANYPAAP